MAQDTLLWVVGADKCVYTELQDFEERWEPSGVPPQRCATQEHLEMLPVHTKPAGYADTWVLGVFLIEPWIHCDSTQYFFPDRTSM